jgi:ABC-type transport system substrate-binding protein
VIRALLREAKLGSYSFYYSNIRGFNDYAAGRAEGISGLLAPDPTTSRVVLEQPSRDLGYLFAMPATAPIPPVPGHSAVSLGVATGHDSGYGRFMVASGPYMVAGAGQLEFPRPPNSQRPLSGYAPGASIALVRNPSWKRSTDPLRAANPDRIEVRLVPHYDAAIRALESKRVDTLVDLAPDPESLVSAWRQTSPRDSASSPTKSMERSTPPSTWRSDLWTMSTSVAP